MQYREGATAKHPCKRRRSQGLVADCRELRPGLSRRRSRVRVPSLPLLRSPTASHWSTAEAGTTLALAALSLLAALAITNVASAYSWPVKPFYTPHPIRGSFGDPRFHLDAEGQLSAFHFGVDIVAGDGTPVYAVAPGVVVRRHRDSVTIGRSSGHRFGYWHIRPVVKSGRHVRLHQLVGYVLKGWGHVHFAESFRGSYRNPLRKGALTPFGDHTMPTVWSVQLLASGGSPADSQHITGAVDILANVYDTPPLAPPPPWDVARLAPASVWWDLRDSNGAIVEASLAASFDFALPPAERYGWIYAAGTYQNKPHRPGQYIFWLAHGLDTTSLPNGAYALEVIASDTRDNIGTATVGLTIANGTASS
jgi:murein DD-endopeptidase MepM/ murein hydrolase activator NlpD